MFRGPQGTLFGRNTPAGVVKFNSVRPSREGGGYAQAAYGTDSSFNFEGAIGGAISEQWSMRVSGIYQHRDDWVDNRLTGQGDALEGFDEVAGRAQFLYESGPLEALVNVHARSLDGIRAHVPRQPLRARHERPRARLQREPGLDRRPERPGARLGRREPAHRLRFRSHDALFDHRLRVDRRALARRHRRRLRPTRSTSTPRMGSTSVRRLSARVSRPSLRTGCRTTTSTRRNSASSRTTGASSTGRRASTTSTRA